MGGKVVRMVDARNVYKVLVGKHLECRPLRKPWRTNVIEMDVTEIE
jgi:hypothetical protein